MPKTPDDNDLHVAGKLKPDPADGLRKVVGIRDGKPVFAKEPEPSQSLPSFPTDALPEVLLRWVQEVARCLEVPEAMPALSALGVVSAALSKTVESRIRGSWIEPVNLYLVMVAGPAERKSPVLSKATAPLWDYQIEEERRQAPEWAAYKRAQAIIGGAIKKLDTKAKTAVANDDRDGAAEIEKQVTKLRSELAEVSRPRPRLCLVDDVTVEALGLTMEAHSGRAVMLSAEGGVFDAMAGKRYQKSMNIDLYLKAFSAEPYVVKRMERSTTVRRPCLTILLAVQPDVLQSIDEAKSLRGRGLVGRFLFTQPETLVGRREHGRPDIDAGVSQLYTALLWRLLGIREDRDEAGEVISKTIAFTPSADAALLAYERRLEKALSRGGDLYLIADWGGKLAGKVARIATLFACVEAMGLPACVDESHVLAAIRLGDYFMAHAEHVLSRMGATDDDREAEQVLGRIIAKGGEVKKRDLKRSLRAMGSDDFEAALGRLIGRGDVLLNEEKRRGRSVVTVKAVTQ